MNMKMHDFFFLSIMIYFFVTDLRRNTNMETKENRSFINKIVDSPVGRNVKYFIRWAIIAYIIGFLGGAIGGLFAMCITKVTQFRVGHPWMIFLMPLAGLLIVWGYQVTGEGKNSGTNMVLASISADEMITDATGPLIFLSTVLTHLVGGSAGREGAALQLGGWIGSQISKIGLFHLDEKEKKMTIMVGMSAVFSALFGTPVAAAFFSMEVISVGIIYYAAMLPCLLAAFLGKDVALKMGIEYDLFSLGDIPKLGFKTVQPVVLLGFLVSVLGILFIIILHGFEHNSRKWIPNPYLRILVCGSAFVVLTALLGTTMYSGSGINLIEKPFFLKSSLPPSPLVEALKAEKSYLLSPLEPASEPAMVTSFISNLPLWLPAA